MSTDLRLRLLAVTDDARRLSQGDAAATDQAVLRRLVNALPCAALVANSEGRYIDANPGTSVLTGYSHRELLMLSTWDLTPARMERDAEILWRAFLQQGEQTGIYELLRKDGRVAKASYAARAHVLPGLHLSLLEAQS